MELLKNLLQYLPYILLFAVATMLIYGWGIMAFSAPENKILK